ncbi:MAG: accessory factor UbiK family protein [Arenicellales bacterium]|jgi:BMFP domain-containing protein YqiC
MLNQLVDSILNLLPSEAREEQKKNIEAVIQGHFEQMNLATREQLEIQEKILRRTRERVNQLEQQIEELEKHQKNQ